MMRSLYIVLSLLIIGGYSYAGWRGLELPSAQKSVAQPGVRGARSFFYGGYRGGK